MFIWIFSPSHPHALPFEIHKYMAAFKNLIIYEPKLRVEFNKKLTCLKYCQVVQCYETLPSTSLPCFNKNLEKKEEEKMRKSFLFFIIEMKF